MNWKRFGSRSIGRTKEGDEFLGFPLNNMIWGLVDLRIGCGEDGSEKLRSLLGNRKQELPVLFFYWRRSICRLTKVILYL